MWYYFSLRLKDNSCTFRFSIREAISWCRWTYSLICWMLCWGCHCWDANSFCKRYAFVLVCLIKVLCVKHELVYESVLFFIATKVILDLLLLLLSNRLNLFLFNLRPCLILWNQIGFQSLRLFLRWRWRHAPFRIIRFWILFWLH